MRDPYAVLGINKSASPEEIKQAYRAKAKKLHPDLNPGRQDIERQFKDVSAAYDLLADPTTRAQFDRGEIAADGSPRFRHGGAGAGSTGGFRYRQGQAPRGQAGGDDLFDQIFGVFGQRGRRGWSPNYGTEDEHAGPPAPLTINANVPFLTAVKGGTHLVRLPTGKDVNVHVPPGTTDGTRLRLPGQGRPGSNGKTGDAIVEITIDEHPILERYEGDIVSDVPISLHEAVLGARVQVETIDGPVTLTVPEGSNGGTRLRLRNKGVPNADGTPAGWHYVTLQIVLDDPGDPELIAFLRSRVNNHAGSI